MRGIDFVAIDPGIAKDPRIAAMAQALHKDRYWVVGRLPGFFGEVAAHCPDGVIGAVDHATLDEWAGGARGFGAQVKAHLCDAGTLRAWWKYNGKALKNLRHDRERKAEARRARAQARAAEQATRKVRGQSEESPRTIHARSSDYTDTDTDTDTRTTQTPTPPANAAVENSVEKREPVQVRIRQALEARHREPFDEMLRASRNPTGVCRVLWAYIDPGDGTQAPGGHPIPPAMLGQAIEELLASRDPAFNAAFFRGIVARLQREAEPPRRRVSPVVPLSPGERFLADLGSER